MAFAVKVILSCESMTALGGPTVPEVYTRWQHSLTAWAAMRLANSAPSCCPPRDRSWGQLRTSGSVGVPRKIYRKM